MNKLFGVFLAASLLAAMPACAGALTFDGGKAAWHSEQCIKPLPPTSILGAHPETSGDKMNQLIAQHNAYVDAAQDYMNCIKNEAANDQAQINQAIASNAQQSISDMQEDVMRASPPLRNRQK